MTCFSYSTSERGMKTHSEVITVKAIRVNFCNLMCVLKPMGAVYFAADYDSKFMMIYWSSYEQVRDAR